MQDCLEEIRDFLEAALVTTGMAPEPLFTKYYVGKLTYPPLNHMPILMVYPTETALVAATTATDDSVFSITIEIVVNIYSYAGTAGIDSDKVALIQKAVVELMEKRNAAGAPLANTVLGALRANIKGTSYNFNLAPTIEYAEEITDGSVFFRGICRLTAKRDHLRVAS